MPWGIWKYFQVDEVSSILLLTNVFANSWNISSINVPKSKLLNRILTYSEKLWVVLVVLKSWRCLSSHVSFSELPIISSGGLLFKKTTANNCDLSIYNISLQKDISFFTTTVCHLLQKLFFYTLAFACDFEPYLTFWTEWSGQNGRLMRLTKWDAQFHRILIILSIELSEKTENYTLFCFWCYK